MPIALRLLRGGSSPQAHPPTAPRPLSGCSSAIRAEAARRRLIRQPRQGPSFRRNLQCGIPSISHPHRQRQMKVLQQNPTRPAQPLLRLSSFRKKRKFAVFRAIRRSNLRVYNTKNTRNDFRAMRGRVAAINSEHLTRSAIIKVASPNTRKRRGNRILRNMQIPFWEYCSDIFYKRTHSLTGCIANQRIGLITAQSTFSTTKGWQRRKSAFTVPSSG